MSSTLIITYDITENKVRTQFSKFLEKYGVRLQFSVFEIQNSKRVLDIVLNTIERKFKDKFEPGDSILIFNVKSAETIRYGSAELLDNPLIIFE